MELTQKLIKIGKLLSLESDIKQIFKIILDEVMEVSNADSGVIYITSEDKKKLHYERVKIVSKGMEMDSESASKRWESINLYGEADEVIMNSLSTFVFHTGFEAHFDDVYAQSFFDISHTKALDKRESYLSKSMVAVPLLDHEEQVLGIIELSNSINSSGKIIPFSETYIDILLSVSSQAAITLSNKLLVKNLEKMIFDFTQAIAFAIDMKSDKSYKHVQKVALITNMLAEKINEVDEGPYAGEIFNQDELDEIAISGWLHDLGKIVTSNCLLNKNTKLLKSCDRICYIRTRFDLVEQVIINRLSSGSINEQEKQQLEEVLEGLPESLELIKDLNKGTESVSEEVIAKLKQIAEFEVSFRDRTYKLLEEDELENLMIKRGTLTVNEYHEIQKHAELTYKILSNITFPAKFRDVPRIAASHHERMNGSGYPLGLKESEIPLQSRMLAIADVFDALMSKRSYKEGYGLRKSLVILAKMTASNELDKDLMDIVLDNKLYLEFAEKYDEHGDMDFDPEEIKKIYR